MYDLIFNLALIFIEEGIKVDQVVYRKVLADSVLELKLRMVAAIRYPSRTLLCRIPQG